MKQCLSRFPMQLLRSYGLRARLVAAIVLVISPLIVIVVLTLGSMSASLLRDAGQRELASSARSTAASIDRWDHYFVLALDNLRGQPDIVTMDPSQQLPVLRQMKSVYDRVEIVRATRPDGLSVARTDGNTPV